MIKFTIPGQPQGKARARTFNNPRTGKTTTTTPEKTVLYENLVKTMYSLENSKAYKNKEPLRAIITCYYKTNKSDSKKVVEKKLSGELRPTVKPDVDNVAKCVLDALNGIAYCDDTQVVELHMYKHYSSDPCVEVIIQECEVD